MLVDPPTLPLQPRKPLTTTTPPTHAPHLYHGTCLTCIRCDRPPSAHCSDLNHAIVPGFGNGTCTEVDLLEGNEHLEEMCFSGARVRDHLSWLSGVIGKGRLPLMKLLLADNSISVAQGVVLVRALQQGAPQLQTRQRSPSCWDAAARHRAHKHTQKQHADLLGLRTTEPDTEPEKSP